MKPYFRKLLSKSIVILTGLALFRERAKALKIATGSGLASDLNFLLGILTSIINSGEESLRIALIELTEY